jgi:hypothetical protein
MTIYPSTIQRDPVIHSLLNQSLEFRAIVALKSVRTQERPRAGSCIVHTPGFCLSAEAVEPAESQPWQVRTQAGI